MSDDRGEQSSSSIPLDTASEIESDHVSVNTSQGSKSRDDIVEEDSFANKKKQRPHVRLDSPKSHSVAEYEDLGQTSQSYQRELDVEEPDRGDANALFRQEQVLQEKEVEDDQAYFGDSDDSRSDDEASLLESPHELEDEDSEDFDGYENPEEFEVYDESTRSSAYRHRNKEEIERYISTVVGRIDWAALFPNRDLTYEQRKTLTYLGYTRMTEKQRSQLDLEFVLRMHEIESRDSINYLTRRRHTSQTAFNGNRRYLSYFAKHAKEVMDFESGFKYDDTARPMFSSYISVKGGRVGKYQYTREGGTYWTKHEKDKFFELLARYSIHDLQSICENLPGKTEIDVLNYYDLLKKETKKYKSSNRYYEKCVRYEEIPAAYEMSEEYVALEEHYARDLILEENRINRKRSWFALHYMKERGYQKPTKLYNESNIYDMFESIYYPSSKNSAVPLTDTNKLYYTTDYFVGLNLAVRAFLKRMMLDIIDLKIKKMSDLGVSENLELQFVNGNSIPLLHIEKQDIIDVRHKMKVPHDIKTMENYWSGIGDRLDAEIVGYDPETEKKEVDRLRRNDIVTQRSSRRYAFSPHMVHTNISTNSHDFDALNIVTSNRIKSESKFYDDVFNEFAADENVTDRPKADKSGNDSISTSSINDPQYTFEEAIKNAVSTESLTTFRARKRTHGRAFNAKDHDYINYEDDEEYSSDEEDMFGRKRFIVGNHADDDLYYNSLAEKLFLTETKLLNLKDHEDSVKYEHVMLNYLSTVSDRLKNDPDFAKYIEYHLNQPEKVGRHRPRGVETAIRMWYATIKFPYSEYYDYELPDMAEHGFTEDMLHLQSYDFPQKFC